VKHLATTFILAAALVLSGCSEDASETASTGATTESAEPGMAPEPALPEGFFLAQAPGNALPLSQARAKARTGDEIAFSGYIGGRAEPFTEGRAIFLVADSKEAPACTDGCPAPWDACCVPGEKVAANSATVQVVDAEGKTLRMNLNGQQGLAPGAEVVVVGKVREANDAVLIVDATGLSVRNQK
jgi:hypothetical protein